MVETRQIAIIGAGPAGAHLAAQLSDRGREVVLFDPRGAWEKPCGGGIPSRALREFRYILEDSAHPRTIVRTVKIISPSGRQITGLIDRPFAVFSRTAFNGLILERAKTAGADFVQAAVTGFRREGDGWAVESGDGRKWRVQFLVGADGAASATRRRLLGIFPAEDLSLAFGYNVTRGAGAQNELPNDEVLVQFPPRLTGYLWAFPRPDATNFGIFSRLGASTSDQMRETLLRFVKGFYGGTMPDESRSRFFGAKIPTLDVSSWKNLRAAGDGWALVGDAAGFADPITGEGIYYALRSADLLADSVLKSNGQAAVTPSPQWASVTSRYEEVWRAEFGTELEHASYRLPQFYRGRLFGYLVTDAMVMLSRAHRGVRGILLRTIMGEQSYLSLKRDLLWSLPRLF